ncbi:hypothetical protein Tco_0502021 [Tanacetum coccineum]
MTATASYKDQPYILATQSKLDEVVIEDDSSYNLALSANLNELNHTNLNIAGHSTEVKEPPPPVIPVDDDGFIDKEDDVPYDLADSDDEVRANHDVDDEVGTMTSVTRGHGGDGAGDPPQAPRRLGSSCERNTRKRDKRGVTGNYELKKAVEKYGPQEIEFECMDQKTIRHIGDNSSWFENYIGELVSSLPYHHPSWRDIDARDKHHFKIDRHLAGPNGEDIKRGIEDYFSKRYSGRKNKYKHEMWTKKGGLGAADQIRRNRPNNVTLDNWNKLVDSWIDPKKAHRAEVNSRNRLANKIVSLQGSRSLTQSRHRYFQNHNEQYPSLIQSYYDLHTKKGVWRDDGSKALYEEMLRLQALGTMTEREILAQVLGGKQRGHLPGIGRKVAGVGTSTVFGSQDEDTLFYSQREMNEVVKKYQKDLAAQQEATENKMKSSSSTAGSTSGTASASGDPSPSGNVDPSSSGSLDGDDEDDGDVS